MYKLVINRDGIHVVAKVSLPVVGEKEIREKIGDVMEAMIIVSKIEVKRREDGKIYEIVLEAEDIKEKKEEKNHPRLIQLSPTFFVDEEGNVYHRKRNEYKTFMRRENIEKLLKAYKLARGDPETMTTILRNYGFRVSVKSVKYVYMSIIRKMVEANIVKKIYGIEF